MIEVYTDGSCMGNPGPGGWAAIIVMANEHKILRGMVPREVTNNQMELLAVIKALHWLEEQKIDDDVLIYSDSNYVVNNISNMYRWEQKNFQDIKNPGLWKSMIKMLDRVPASFLKVKAHNGDTYNELADKHAQIKSKQAKRMMGGK